MKICFIIDAWKPWWGGGQEHVLQVSKILKADVIHPKNNFFNFWSRVWFTLWTIKFYLTSDYDLYHSHSFSTSAFLPLVKLRGKKTAVTIHGVGKNIIGARILNNLKISNFLMWLVLYVWPYDYKFSAGSLKGFITVGNGVDINEFSEIKRLSHKIFTILCISRRDPVKGIEILEKAVKEIPGIKLNLVSSRQRTISDFASADLYVLPSLSEGLPIVLLEAMAAKLPIVATDVGDCKKLIETAKCGIIVPAGNVKKLVEAILEIKANKREYGENGYKFVKKNYSWKKVAAYYNSAYCGANSFV